MKYCCEFTGEFPKLECYDEVIVKLFANDDITNIRQFFDKYPKQTVIIHLVDNSKEYIDKNLLERLLNILPTSHFKYKLKLNNPYDENTGVLVDYCHENEIPFFFDMLVDDWDILQYIIDLHPTDVYIVNQLGFELPILAPMLHSENIDVRVYPNIAQSANKYADPVRKFYVRPEDLDVYTPFVDVYEFLIDANENTLKQLYYIIYAEETVWEGPLNLLIAGLDVEFDNRGVYNSFGMKRLMCGKKCVKNRSCNFCENIKNTANLMTDEGYGLEYPKSKNRQTAWTRLTKAEQDALRKVLLENFENI